MSLSSRVLKARFPPSVGWRMIHPCRRSGEAHLDETERLQAVEERLEEARAQAEALLSGAETEAARIRELAEAEAEQLARQASKEGYEQGLANGLAEGQRRGQEEALEANRACANRLAELLRAAEEEQYRLLSDMEPRLIELALGIARKVVGAELKARPELVLEVLARAIEQARGEGRHTVHLHPEDLQLVRPHLPQAALEAGGGQWSLAPDESLSPGDCLIETDFGVVDARISTQMAELTRLLLGGEDDGRTHH